jgi:transcription antitermination factor NusG
MLSRCHPVAIAVRRHLQSLASWCSAVFGECVPASATWSKPCDGDCTREHGETSMCPWWVIQTAPNCEHKAIDDLKERLGFEAYSPQTQVRLSNRGRRRWVRRYLFSRYVFVRVTDQWHRLMTADGVTAMLMKPHTLKTDPQPAALADSVVDELRARENSSGIVELRKFKRGQMLSLIEGAFSGFTCLYEGMGQHDREIVLLSALGAQRRIEVPTAALAPY